MPLASLSCQEFHGSAIDESDLREIDGDRTAFLLERGAKDFQVFPGDPPTDAQTRHDRVQSESRSIRQVIARRCRLALSVACNEQTETPLAI